MQTMVELFFGRRRTPLRWLAAAPGVVALALLGHALEDAGLLGAFPYVAVILLSVGYMIRPMVVLWIVLFGVFALYSLAVALHLERIIPSERILFLSIALAPTILMLLAWPMKAKEA